MLQHLTVSVLFHERSNNLEHLLFDIVGVPEYLYIPFGIVHTQGSYNKSRIVYDVI